jgi:hypothetical protein
MGHYAKVENGFVTDVIVAEQDYISTLPDASAWVQTSYNTRGNVHYYPNSNTPDGQPPLRGNYAGIGYIYDSVNDVFYEQKGSTPASWVLSTTTWLWEAPVPYPNDGKLYNWDEDVVNWVLSPLNVSE